MYDPVKKQLFIHIGKVGGTSIQNYYLHHLVPETRKLEWSKVVSVEYYKKFLLKGFGTHNPHLSLCHHQSYCNIDDYFKFTILRKPSDLVYSLFYEQRRRIKAKNYEEYILTREFKQTIQPFSILGDCKGNLPYDKIFVYERLDEVFDHIDTVFSNKLPRIHLKHRPKLNTDNTSGLQNIVNSEFRDLYKLWHKHYNNG
tara:strand:- start:584 stop:1180 length:597 start_codon:yes stop_codon:yes gene_type:complete